MKAYFINGHLNGQWMEFPRGSAPPSLFFDQFIPPEEIEVQELTSRDERIRRMPMFRRHEYQLAAPLLGDDCYAYQYRGFKVA